ncbi:MAG TPA: hypothetical protein VHC97_02225 [Thermoanaerobaculia bacterium]|jgi:hypothetical protein|nr:hypothetical protein [Thermoanaerobaculia bacterium]
MAIQNESALPGLHRKFLETFNQQVKAAREDKTVPEDPAAREALLAGFRERLGSLQDQKKRALARFDEEIQHLESTLASLEKGGPDKPKPALKDRNKKKRGR